MRIVNENNDRDNWHEITSLWNRVVNWTHYNTSERELKQQIKSLIIYLWNEKDWLKKEHPSRSKEIENYISDSDHIKIVADLANTIKHKGLDRNPRSNTSQTDYYGKIRLGKDKARYMYYIQCTDDSVEEIFQVMRGAMKEYQDLYKKLRKDSL